MELEVDVVVTDKYKPLYDLPLGTNTVVCIGGRGGMKTYEVSKFVASRAVQELKRVVVVRDEKTQIKESILNEIWSRYETANEDGILDGMFSKNEYELKHKETGDTLIYTKGFKATSNDKKSNLKGAANIDFAIIEEAEDIREVEKYNTFVDSLRKEGCIVIIMLNVPDINHWIVKRWFITEPVYDILGEIVDGYFNLVPKKIAGFFCIQSTFEDNSFLPNHIVARYKGYGDPESELYNLHYYLTEIKGYASTGRKGQIFPKVKPISLKDYLDLPFKEYYGQDFGTARPAAMCGAKLDRNNIYARQLNYEPMDVLDIAKMYCKLKFTPQDRIIADCAEPPSISKLANGFKDLGYEDYEKYPELASGFYVVPCTKGPGSVNGGISLLKSMNIYLVIESEEFWDEQRKYIWETDKDGKPTGDPKDEFNHLWDGLRYIAVDQRGLNSAVAY